MSLPRRLRRLFSPFRSLSKRASNKRLRIRRTARLGNENPVAAQVETLEQRALLSGNVAVVILHGGFEFRSHPLDGLTQLQDEIRDAFLNRDFDPYTIIEGPDLHSSVVNFVEAVPNRSAVILIGYSRGAKGALEVADRLAEKDIDVDMAVFLDAVSVGTIRGVTSPLIAGDNIRNGIHIYQDPFAEGRESALSIGGLTSDKYAVQFGDRIHGLPNIEAEEWWFADANNRIDHSNIDDHPGVRSFVAELVTGTASEHTNKIANRAGIYFADEPYFAHQFGTLQVSDELHRVPVDLSVGQSYSIVTEGAGTIYVELFGLNANFRGSIRLRDANGRVVATDQGISPQGNIELVFENGIGGSTYFVEVLSSGSGDRGTGTGLLTVTSGGSSTGGDQTYVPPPPRVHHDAAGQTHLAARAIALSPINKGDDSGEIDANDDLDHYSFVAKVTGRVEIEVNPRSRLKTRLTILDPAFDQNGDGIPDGRDSDISDNKGKSYLEYDVIVGQTYYVRVQSSDQRSRGRYDLHIRPYDPAYSNGDGEEDDTLGDEIVLDGGGNGTARGSVNNPTDVVWYHAFAAVDGYLRATLNGVNDDLREFITAFRADFSGIDTGGGSLGTPARVTIPVSAGELIYLAVSSLDGRYTGAFDLTILNDATVPDDDWADLGEPAEDISGNIDPHGNGFVRGRIETPDDNDWFKIPVDGSGYLSIEVVTRDGSLIPFLELSRDGTTGGFFETDDGRDGRASVTFIPEPGMDYVWAKASGVEGTQGEYSLNVWRTQNREDDHPDSGGVYQNPHRVESGSHLIFRGRNEHVRDKDSFRIEVADGGPLLVQVISLTEGYDPLLRWSRSHPDPNLRTGTEGANSGRGGRVIALYPDIQAAPDNWLSLNIEHEGSSTVPAGDYIIFVWKPGSATDLDPDTVGIESAPILVDGTGNGSLPGSPNNGDPPPMIDHAGDRDVFQMRTASDRPMTFTVAGNGFETFLRVYDGSGTPIGTDHNSGPGGESTYTVEAYRGEVYYLEVTAYDGTSTGSYSITVSQPTDDHPDAPVFHPVENQTRDATVIALDGSGFGQATGQIETSLVGDRDLFQVQATMRGRMTVNVATTDDMLDTFLRVYDSRGNLVAVDDDSGDRRDSTVTFNTFQDEVYTIEVSGYGDNSVGSYEVTVQTSGPQFDQLIGTYDDFSGGFNTEKWSLTYGGAPGFGDIQSTGGTLQLIADGRGAPDDNTAATIASRAYVQEGVSFDVSSEFGGSYNVAWAEIIDADGNYIRVQLNRHRPEATNVIAVDASGYATLQNDAPHDTTSISFTENTLYNFRIENVGDEIHVLMDDVVLARFSGNIRPDSYFQVNARSAQAADRYAMLTIDNVAGTFRLPESVRDRYSDFEGYDTSNWSLQAVNGPVFADATTNSGVLELFANGDGAPNDNTRATLTSRQQTGGGVAFDLSGDMGVSYNHGSAELTDMAGHSIRIQLNRNWPEATNVIVIGSSGYTELKNTAPHNTSSVTYSENTIYHFRIENVGNEIHVTMDNTVLARFAGAIELDSYLVFNSQSTAAAGRHARLMIENVEFLDSAATTYDDFEEGPLDRWQIVGDVEIRDGALVASLFRGGQPVTGYASTAGIPGGTNLRGFKLQSTRTSEPKQLQGWDTWARMHLTNGTDYIAIAWDLQNNQFDIDTVGAYGSHHVDIGVPAGEIPDGPLEVRERGGGIEVLHNNNVKLRIEGQTIRAGSYFTFETHGNPFGQSMNNPPQDYVAIIDNIEFYYDRVPSEERVLPSLAASSDTGDSNTDHVTNSLSLDFEWEAGMAGTTYQWRTGELLEDGTITWSGWSDPQGGTTAHVDLPHASIHVFSLRPIDPDGIVGQASSRGVSVDVDAPRVVDVDWTDELQPALVATFDEPIFGDASEITVRDANGQVVTPLTVTGFGTTELEITFASVIPRHSYMVTLNGTASLTDSAGNRLDGDTDGTEGGDFVTTLVSPAFIVNGTTAAVAGTDSSDNITLNLGTRQVSVNGTLFNIPGNVTAVQIDGRGGVDSLTVDGTAGPESVRLLPMQAFLDSSSVGLIGSATSVETVVYNGNGGNDLATFSDSAGNDIFTGSPTESRMRGPGYTNIAHVPNTIALASTGNDRATLNDGPGRDRFLAWSNRALMSGTGYSTQVFGYDSVTGIASVGNDIALLHDGTGNDTFIGRPTSSARVGTGFSNAVVMFDRVIARSFSGNDIGRFFGSTGNDIYSGRPGFAAMSGAGFDFSVENFSRVVGRGGDGTDMVRFYGGSGDDLFVAASDLAQMSGPGYDLQAYHFTQIVGVARPGGNDRAHLFDSPGDDDFTGFANFGQLTGLGFSERAIAFDFIRIFGTRGGRNRLNLFPDNPINYQLIQSGSWA